MVNLMTGHYKSISYLFSLIFSRIYEFLVSGFRFLCTYNFKMHCLWERTTVIGQDHFHTLQSNFMPTGPRQITYEDLFRFSLWLLQQKYFPLPSELISVFMISAACFGTAFFHDMEIRRFTRNKAQLLNNLHQL